jgi:superoxide reductase
MSEIGQIFKCPKCALTLAVLTADDCAPDCCGAPMVLLRENTSEGAKEKHYIQWIELTEGGVVHLKHLKPGDAPEAVFKTGDGPAVAREYCNLHGLWKA